MAYFSALFPKVISTIPWLAKCYLLTIPTSTFSSPDIMSILHKHLPNWHVHWLFHRHFSVASTKDYCFSSTYFKLHSPCTPHLGKWYHHSTSCSSQTLLSFHVTISKPKVILWALPPTSDYFLPTIQLQPESKPQ